MTAWRRREVIGDAVLYLGDCRDILPEIGKVDAVVTDPPYGMNWNSDSTRFSGGERKRGAGVNNWPQILGDDKPFDPTFMLQYRDVVLWGANHFAARLPVGSTLVWLKKHPVLFGTFLSDAEIGWTSGGHGVYAYYEQFPPPSRMAENNGKVAHQNQKPIGLLTWCIQNFTEAGSAICDPYMGSGTTGVACVRLGRRFIGIEIEETYFNIACRRIAEAERQPDLFIAPKPAQERML